jgi:hypothetical protein
MSAATAAAAASTSGAAAIAAAAAAAPNYQLLGYEQQIVQEMVEQDALCIMGAGLGWHRVIAAMLQMHDSSSNGEQHNSHAQPACNGMREPMHKRPLNQALASTVVAGSLLVAAGLMVSR